MLIGTGEGILAMPWQLLTLPGNFVIAALLTQYYGLGKATYGLIVSLPMWSNAAQIVVLPWLARFLTPKELAIHKTPATKCIESGGHQPARQTPPAMVQQNVGAPHPAGGHPLTRENEVPDQRDGLFPTEAHLTK